jgi:hypothetical protein
LDALSLPASDFGWMSAVRSSRVEVTHPMKEDVKR